MTDAATLKRVQRALTSAGHDAGTPDGVMGTRTRRALRSYQRASGLDVTGAADLATRKRLGIEPKPRASRRRSPRSLLLLAAVAAVVAVAGEFVPGLRGADAGAIADALDALLTD